MTQPPNNNPHVPAPGPQDPTGPVPPPVPSHDALSATPPAAVPPPAPGSQPGGPAAVPPQPPAAAYGGPQPGSGAQPPSYGEQPGQPGQPAYGAQPPGQPAYGAQQPGLSDGAQLPGQPYGTQPPGQPAYGTQQAGQQVPGGAAGVRPARPEQLAAMRRDLPADVRDAARSRGFGELLHGRSNAQLVNIIVGAIVAVVGFGLLAGLGALAPDDTFGNPLWFLLRWVGRLSCFAGVLGLVWVIRSAVLGSLKVYLFQGGLVSRHRSAVTALAYQDIASVTRKLGTRGSAKGNVVGYDVAGRDGTTLTVPHMTNDDGFIATLYASVHAAGGRVA